jgi:alkyl hydroperoxide reductase subunit AhpC
MLGVGERIPEATVWTLEREPVSVRSLAEGGPSLLVFYLFDFSST